MISGCTSDDICEEGSPTTPLLIITFKDFINPEVSKEVTSLTIKTDEENPVVLLHQATTDSIAIPLNTNTSVTKLFFIKNDNEEDTGNYDVVTFTYQTQPEYVNRACGYKVNYNNLDAQLETENTTNWIQQINLLQTTVKDETSTHISILH